MLNYVKIIEIPNFMKVKLFVLFCLLINIFSFSDSFCDTGKKELDCSSKISLNRNNWKIAVDSQNIGIQKKWFESPPVKNAHLTPIPWIIQDIFHNYHGVAWYWCEFDTPGNKIKNGHYFLKFQAVDYMGDIWINGEYIGNHEGSETPFEFDVTKNLKKEGSNLLVVRVLNPTYEPINGIALKETPSGAKNYPFGGNASYNTGGIIGEVEIYEKPPLQINNLYALPDWKTGNVKVQVSVSNQNQKEIKSSLLFNISEIRSGLPILIKRIDQYIKQGKDTLKYEASIPDHKLWSIENPNLYRISVSVEYNNSVDECVSRFGFRDFRFREGYFQLNGKRIFLKGSNFSMHYPVGVYVPTGDDMLRRDVINMKALGFNFVRIPFGCPNYRVLDIYDELGIMVFQEHFGSWQMGEYAKCENIKQDGREVIMINRFKKSIVNVVERDRNNPCIIMWGMLNETKNGAILHEAVNLLSQLRALDPLQIFVLNSGRFDNMSEIGSMSNSGSLHWDIYDHVLKDWHPYVWMPYKPNVLDELSGKNQTDDQKVFPTETGLCFPIDLLSDLGEYQIRGKENSDDAQYLKRQFENFTKDWDLFSLNDIWICPEDYIKDAYKTAAILREIAETAIRSNPHLVGYCTTNSVADLCGGESVATNFRKLKPELINSVLLANSSLRWCLRTEPQSVYSGDQIRLKVYLSNLDYLLPGNYPATIKVIDSQLNTIAEKKLSIKIRGDQADPFALDLLDEDITINEPEGKYKVWAKLDQVGFANAGITEYYVTVRDKNFEIPGEVILIGNDSIVINWLTRYNCKILHFTEKQTKRQLIIISGQVPDSITMQNVARQMAQGSTVIFLAPSSLKKGNNSTYWLPLDKKGIIAPMDDVAEYYRSDRWVKRHPFFEGLPSGGMMDYIYFSNIISKNALSGHTTIPDNEPHTFIEKGTPLTYLAETVCGATRISHTYCSGIQLGIWNFEKGKFIVNMLNIAENLGKDPAADRLFCYILRYASRDLNIPLAKLPADFNLRLAEIGYQNRTQL
jgi:hypothetical protein